MALDVTPIQKMLLVECIARAGKVTHLLDFKGDDYQILVSSTDMGSAIHMLELLDGSYSLLYSLIPKRSIIMLETSLNLFGIEVFMTKLLFLHAYL